MLVNDVAILRDMERFGMEITEETCDVVVIKAKPTQIMIQDIMDEAEVLTERFSIGINHPNFVAEFMMWKNKAQNQKAVVRKIEDIRFGSLYYARISFVFEE